MSGILSEKCRPCDIGKRADDDLGRCEHSRIPHADNTTARAQRALDTRDRVFEHDATISGHPEQEGKYIATGVE